MSSAELTSWRSYFLLQNEQMKPKENTKSDFERAFGG